MAHDHHVNCHLIHREQLANICYAGQLSCPARGPNREFSMAEPIITCPNCRSNIPLTESLAAPLLAATREKYEQALTQKDRDVAKREAALREQLTALERERASIDQQVFDKLQAERVRIAQEEAAKAKRLAAADLEEKGDGSCRTPIRAQRP